MNQVYAPEGTYPGLNYLALSMLCILALGTAVFIFISWYRLDARNRSLRRAQRRARRG